MDVDDAPLPSRPIDVTRAEILTRLLGQFTPGRGLDLACGTGWFTQLAAGLGWKMTAMDIRRRPWPELPGVTWHEMDVRDADPSGYDLILCLGIFYHLTAGDQLDLLARCAGTPMILDTHVSLAPDTETSGYTGHLYAEPEGLLSSWGNRQSFWPDIPSLERMLRDHGWTVIEPVEPWYHGTDRTFWTCRP